MTSTFSPLRTARGIPLIFQAAADGIDRALHEHVAKILVIEDDLSIRQPLADLLKLQGHAIAEADNGRDGLERLREGARPDVILLDLQMPEMNGWQFLESFEQDRTLRVPVIVFSGDADLAPRSARVVATLRKTVDLAVLLSAIQSAIG